MSVLVVVESPTKARTISNFLPDNYKVLASMGHIRDLPQSAAEIPTERKKEPWAQLGVNPDKDFEPMYVIPKGKKKVITELKSELKKAELLILATDEDREGESISWHLLQELKPKKVPVQRMVFHEITKEAIDQALKDFREIDTNLVRAQETRRILDRLVGYTVSPLLWKKISTGLSAGRVQSVAVRMLVNKEQERRAFHSGSYWDIKARLAFQKSEFDATLTHVNDERIATGKDFDENTGKIAKGKKVHLLREQEARELQNLILSSEWQVKTVEQKPSTRKPSAPFTTSSLQQEANRKLKISAKDTMRSAQTLYENGFITYMRTDSVTLSNQAIEAARDAVTKLYGKEYLSDKPRTYKNKSKGAQEAHEAIRPAGNQFKKPEETGLKGRELALYDLIWKRTVACQMADAKQTHIGANIQVEHATFRATGKKIDFPGFFRAYVEGTDDPDAALDNKEIILPDLKENDKPSCKGAEAGSHETQPPARYTEASLVKKLEGEGIGRPSTYATIIGTIIDRGYAVKQGEALVPSFTAFAVSRLMEKHFPDLVNPGFTAGMESSLDEIANGELEWLPYLNNFFKGEEGLHHQVELKTEEIPPGEFRNLPFEELDIKVCIGKYGPYLEKTENEETITASVPRDLTPADLDINKVESIFRQKLKMNNELGVHPNTGEPIYLLTGTYGPYVQLGETQDGKPKPKRTSLPKGMKEDEVTLDIALFLLSLPKTLGEHPDHEGMVQVGVGRFGPYVVYSHPENGKDYRSLKADDNLLEITLERALELLAQPKRTRRGANAEPLKDLGKHPDDGEPVQVFNGPYGPYVKHGKTNASIPKDVTKDSITLEKAVELIAEKASSKPKKRTTRRTSRKKS